MNSKEGTDLVKASIIILLIVLVLGATLALFYLMSDKTNDYVRSMNKATTSVNMDKFRELQDMSQQRSDGVLTSVVAASLQEFKDDDLLYIQVICPDKSVIVYTYDSVDVSAGLSGSYETVVSVTPTVDCTKKLLQYTDKRCFVTVVENSGIVKDNIMCAIVVEIKDK